MADVDLRCEICGRKLRNPESRTRGRGVTCDRKVNPQPTPTLIRAPRAAPPRADDGQLALDDAPVEDSR